MDRFRAIFFDWNELRVSSYDEIRAALADLPNAEGKARRLRRFLRQLFVRTYGFDLEHLGKKPLKESAKVLRDFEACRSDFVLATVLQRALGGHAMPVDESIRRCLSRLGIVEEDASIEAARSALEHAVPKSRGAEFDDLLEALAHDVCVAGEPRCRDCVLVKLCPTGQHHREAARAPKAAKAATTSPAEPSRGNRRRDVAPAPAEDAAPARKSGGRSPRAK